MFEHLDTPIFNFNIVVEEPIPKHLSHAIVIDGENIFAIFNDFILLLEEEVEALENEAYDEEDGEGLASYITGGEDNVSHELISLAKEGKEQEFKELAQCYMSVENVDDCWQGVKRRLML